MLDALTPEDRTLAEERVRSVLGGEASPGTEFRGRRKDGSTFQAIIRSVPLVQDGRVIGLRGVVIDLTERKRGIARLLHDEIAQNLTAIGFDLAQVEKALPPSLPLAARTRLLEDLGLAPALRWLGDQFSMRTGVHVVEHIDDLDGRRLRVEDEVHLFRIARELLSNVGRHAEAREVTFSFVAEGGRARRLGRLRAGARPREGAGGRRHPVGALRARPRHHGGRRGAGLIRSRQSP